MAFTKFIYNLINWKNKSESLTTPLGATNLNKMDSAIKKINDNLNSAYDEISSEKLDKSTAYTMVKDVTYNSGTGVFTVTKLNDTTLTIDTKLEKIVTNWKYDKDSQKLILTLDDGTTQEVDLSALITQYEFKDSDTIAFTVESDGSVTANVKDGSITDKKIQPNYLADITTQASNAETSAQNASDYADDASYDAKLAQSYAVGGSGIRDGEETNNAKYYSEQANKEANNASGFAESASAFAENANRNASYASSYANTASTHATNAEASAQSANKSANSASGYAENANTSAELANRSASYASSYANTASTHASNASASAQSASDSASAAEESAKNAKAEADKIVEIAGGDIVLQSEKGEANGVAPLDENALIPSEYVPSGAGRKYAIVGSDSANSGGWYKFASGTLTNNDNLNVMFAITMNYYNYYSGILAFQLRAENNQIACKRLEWHTRIGFSSGSVIFVTNGLSYSLYINVNTIQDGRILIESMAESTRSLVDTSKYMTLHNSTTPESTEPVATVTSSDGATVLRAIQDGNGNEILTNYAGKRNWLCPTQVGAWSRICSISGSATSHLLTVMFSQNGQATCYTYVIGTGYGTGYISQIGTSAYRNNANLKIRLTRNSDNYIGYFVEVYQEYGYNDATSVYAQCGIVCLERTTGTSGINVYEEYTPTAEGAMSVCTLTSQKYGIVSENFYGNLIGNANTATKAIQDGNGKVIADTYATLSDLNSASQNLNNSINRLDLNKASIHTKTTTSTGSASFTVKVGSIIFITTGQASSAGNHLMIAQVRSEGVLSDIYKSSTSAAISLSLSALTLSVGIGSSSGATITVLS